MRIVLTTTWNSEDVIAMFLSHYRRLAFDRIVVMDFDSTDGTKDILMDPRWRDFVTIFPFPGLSGLDSSNIMLDYARKAFPPDTLALFCDPDELLVLPRMNAPRDVPLDLGGNHVSGWVFPRNNMTCKRSLALAHQDDMHAMGTLRFRAGGAVRQNHVALIEEDRLEPAWIFTQLPGKVLVKLSDTTVIGDGDHTATTFRTLHASPRGTRILHYPFRTLHAFEKKIVMATQDFATNTGAPHAYGWQLRRWIRLAEQGLLFREYLEQFPEDEDFRSHLAAGQLVEDNAAADFHLNPAD